MKLIIYTDGASRGNPGKASYGFVVSDSDGKLVVEQGKYVGINTNNFAEYSAVLAAYQEVIKRFKALPREIVFYMDSKLVVEQLSGRYKVKSPNLIPLILAIRKLQLNFEAVSYNHVPREKNKEADRQANIALDNLL